MYVLYPHAQTITTINVATADTPECIAPIIKYGAKIVGFKNDKDRIPEIDIFVENNQIWMNEDFEAKIIHIPGHTSGHICFYFSKNKIHKIW